MMHSGPDPYASVALEEDAAEVPQYPTTTRTLPGLKAAVCAIVLVSCVALALTCQTPKTRVGSARMLLESPEVVHMMTKYHMATKGSRRIPTFAEWEKVRGSIEAHIAKRTPTADVLDSTELTQDEQEGLLHVLRHIGDKRIRRLGAEFVKDAKDESGNYPSDKRRIAELFQARSEAFGQLRAEIFDELPGRLARTKVQQPRRLRHVAPSRRLWTLPLTTPIPLAYAYTTTPMDPFNCEEVEATLDDGESAWNMFNMVGKDQVEKMTGDSPVVKTGLAAVDDGINFFKCMNAMRIKRHNTGCKPEGDDLEAFVPNEDDAEEMKDCWDDLEPALLKVADSSGLDLDAVDAN